MNLVEELKNRLSSGLIEQLSSLTGAGEGAIRSAIGAAVPALLSALSGLVSSSSGSQKLLAALEPFGGGSAESLGQKLSSDPGSVLEQGSSIVNSLFGSNTLSAIVNSLCRFANIPPGAAEKLLGYLTPMILGSIASRFAGKPMDAQGLSSMFQEHKADIAGAIPTGFSLEGLPGLAAAGSAARSAAREVEGVGSSMPRWLLPLVGVAAAAAVVWMLLPSSTAPQEQQEPMITRAQSPDAGGMPVPDALKKLAASVTSLSNDLTGTFSKLTEVLSGIKDAPTAEAALPGLKDLDAKLDGARTAMKKLQAGGQTTIKELVKSSQGKIKSLVDKVLALPGVGDKIKPVADAIMAKLNELAA